MLSAYGVDVEGHGGDVQVVPISALKVTVPSYFTYVIFLSEQFRAILALHYLIETRILFFFIEKH